MCTDSSMSGLEHTHENTMQTLAQQLMSCNAPAVRSLLQLQDVYNSVIMFMPACIGCRL
jgi:hypothetical protein